MTPLLELETSRLRLVPWADHHLAPFAALNADPEVMRFFPSTLDEASTRAGIALFWAHFDANGFGNWAVELRATGGFIGFVGLNIPRRRLPFSPCVEVGWPPRAAVLGPRLRHRGGAGVRVRHAGPGRDRLVHGVTQPALAGGDGPHRPARHRTRLRPPGPCGRARAAAALPVRPATRGLAGRQRPGHPPHRTTNTTAVRAGIVNVPCAFTVLVAARMSAAPAARCTGCSSHALPACAGTGTSRAAGSTLRK
jgi:hypothetical protein